jgi:hypothetical protein
MRTRAHALAHAHARAHTGTLGSIGVVILRVVRQLLEERQQQAKLATAQKAGNRTCGQQSQLLFSQAPPPTNKPGKSLEA